MLKPDSSSAVPLNSSTNFASVCQRWSRVPDWAYDKKYRCSLNDVEHRYFPSDDSIVGGVYEYSAPARLGKSTLIVADCCNKLLNPAYYGEYCYLPGEVFSNLWFDINGIHFMHNEQMLEVLMRAKTERWPHKVFIIDECSQPPLFYARNTRDKIQTELVTSLWQMPKLGTHLLYSSNVGNSVDIQQRDATFWSILPFKYVHAEKRCDDKILFNACNGRDLMTNGHEYLGCELTQSIFRSTMPIF